MSWTATEGVVEVHYEVEADLEPACQGPLVAGLRAATARGPTALLFEVKVVKVSAAVANFWVDVVESVGPNLTHMGIVSESVMVRALTGAFSMAMRIRRSSLSVEVFDNLSAARAWACRARGENSLAG
jgi:hypothetical protein